VPGRLQQIWHILQVLKGFFFEDATEPDAQDCVREAPSPAYVFDFLATSEGLALTQALTRGSSDIFKRSRAAVWTRPFRGSQAGRGYTTRAGAFVITNYLRESAVTSRRRKAEHRSFAMSTAPTWLIQCRWALIRRLLLLPLCGMPRRSVL
jgi:hypothetical protein